MTIHVHALLHGVYELCLLSQNITALYIGSSVHFSPLIYKYKHIKMRNLIANSTPTVVRRKWSISAANVLRIADGTFLRYYSYRSDS